jgi:hypothetical protein
MSTVATHLGNCLNCGADLRGASDCSRDAPQSSAYPEHLYLALHTHALVFTSFAFRMLTVNVGQPWAEILGVVRPAFLVWYVATAFHAVYGGGWARAITTGVVVSLLYSVVVIATLVGMVLVALLV